MTRGKIVERLFFLFNKLNPQLKIFHSNNLNLHIQEYQVAKKNKILTILKIKSLIEI